jgi:hypothetical protein
VVAGYHFDHYGTPIDAHKIPVDIELITESYRKELRATQMLADLMSDLRWRNRRTSESTRRIR